MTESPATQQLFHTRRPGLGLTHALPITALVLAPPAYYTARGQKHNALAPARRLVRSIHARVGCSTTLATWDPSRRAIAAVR
jgi:hypothetical protein